MAQSLKALSASVLIGLFFLVAVDLEGAAALCLDTCGCTSGPLAGYQHFASADIDGNNIEVGCPDDSCYQCGNTHAGSIAFKALGSPANGLSPKHPQHCATLCAQTADCVGFVTVPNGIKNFTPEFSIAAGCCFLKSSNAVVHAARSEIHSYTLKKQTCYQPTATYY